MFLNMYCKKVKRGSKTNGNSYCMIGFGDGITGFVSKDDLKEFDNVQEGDLIEVEAYNFRDDGGIKLIPRRIISE